MPANTSPSFINGRTGLTDKTEYFFVSAVDTPLILSSGKILADSGAGIARFNSDGSPDAFTIMRPPNIANGSIMTEGFQLQGDGGIVSGGTWLTYKEPVHDTGYAVFRIKPNGAIDPGFGSGKGWVGVSVGDQDEAASTLVQSDGKILVIGTTKQSGANGDWNTGDDSRISMVRFTADGKVDSSFANQGIMIGPDSRAHAETAVLQADGKILVAGYWYKGPFFQAAVYRFNSDGSPDMTFGSDGMARITFAGQRDGYSSVQSMILQPDGKILLAGYAPANGDPMTTGNAFGIARLDADGRLDASFGNSGTVLHFVGADQGSWIPGGSQYGTSHANSLLLGDDGTILVAGGTQFRSSDGVTAEGQMGVLALHSDGSVNENFGRNGIATFGAGNGWTVTATGSTFDAQGKILLTGHIVPSITSGGVEFVMARLEADGSVDGSFGGLPAATTTWNGVTWNESLPAVRLNEYLLVQDSELASENFDGASVTLQRQGNANASDAFGTAGSLAFSNGKALLDSVEIGTVSNAGGVLRIDFNANAKLAQVNQTLQSITYHSTADLSSTLEIPIQWTFNDGNKGGQGDGGALSATFHTAVTLKPAGAPAWIEQLLGASGPAPISNTHTLGVSLVTDPGAKPFSATETGQLNAMLAKLAAAANVKLSPVLPGSSSNLIIHSSPELAVGQVKYQDWTGDGADVFIRMPTGSNAATMLAVQEQVARLLGLRDSGNGIDLFGTLETAALQYLYGASSTVRAGNDTYKLSATENAFIWDGAGNDTISAADLATGVTVHLEAGHWDHISGKATAITAAGQFTVNYGSVIENAIGSSGNDHLYGTAGANVLRGGAGNDVIMGYGGDDGIDGGAGMDTAIFAGKRNEYMISATSSGHTITSDDGRDTLTGIERLHFADGDVALDINGNAGQVQRLYQAMFNRAPDQKGLGFWIDARDKGMSLNEIAVFFTQGTEFKSLYGAAPSHGDLITKLYQFALHRAPDADGFAFWQGLMEKQQITLGELLTSFSESPENHAQVIGSIQNGIAYTQWVS
jgi:uncharacterized delta-60 repeat protein